MKKFMRRISHAHRVSLVRVALHFLVQQDSLNQFIFPDTVYFPYHAVNKLHAFLCSSQPTMQFLATPTPLATTMVPWLTRLGSGKISWPIQGRQGKTQRGTMQREADNWPVSILFFFHGNFGCTYYMQIYPPWTEFIFWSKQYTGQKHMHIPKLFSGNCES